MLVFQLSLHCVIKIDFKGIPIQYQHFLCYFYISGTFLNRYVLRKQNKMEKSCCNIYLLTYSFHGEEDKEEEEKMDEEEMVSAFDRSLGMGVHH